MSASERQHTLAKPASITGISLHTGEQVTLTLQPAPEDFGFKFRRIDLEDKPFIPALVEKVQKVERATTIAEGGVNVHTVEHVISALTGMGVDNAIIEMDANEPPIVDGSSQPFVELIKKAGIVAQNAPRKVFEIREPIYQETRDGTILTIVPDKKFRISCTNVGPGGRFTQFISLEINPEVYEKEIAPARTFVYYEDIAPLMEKGLIKGGTLEAAVVVRGETLLSKQPLRFDNEFVRHKILDIIGDLMLCGRRITGHVIAVRPGHGPNTELARSIDAQYKQMRSMVPPPLAIPTGEAVLDVTQVMKLLPHRYPFLLVDRIIGLEGETKCTGVKNVTINEPFFQGHFPGHPVMPGVLQLEAMAQVASIVLMKMPEHQGKIGYFMSANNVKWRKPVFPGDTLIIETEMLKVKRSIAQATARITVNGVVVSEADLMFSVVDR
ncbi:bifunctional UDP-3-O-[3-hydroxymyristoyl] N-acetylglucosamine deacetylase/3-hydroxyacyl-ACP dehydratase [Brevifollis gellanilyticus]|uniref:Multifunctional fusion protein n=1 Tax=Brevifollis gellanilyticus TaxID=748831 RepID=A0A512M8F9_9BACT|nr:bifunctional UDP-3-O-[3-hydroxymyristoyl] N-acetylglucosamine deacetylase/3-hydroxyacyl-ACP dehydratase [Brevifollis gellanilyticus]GEP43017.1 bifunctional enzyme LpxC/FabZ [Brevifollis gellanilyticus]